MTGALLSLRMIGVRFVFISSSFFSLAYSQVPPLPQVVLLPSPLVVLPLVALLLSPLAVLAFSLTFSVSLNLIRSPSL